MTSKKILVVEDENSLRKAITASLQKRKYDVFLATSAAEAISTLSASKDVDAIWLDHYLLNDETGIDLLAKIRSNKDWSKMPVFVVSNSVDDQKVEQYHLLGIEKYYVKAENSLDTIITDIDKYFK